MNFLRIVGVLLVVVGFTAGASIYRCSQPLEVDCHKPVVTKYGSMPVIPIAAAAVQRGADEVSTAVAFRINGITQAIVFVSKSGDTSIVGAQECNDNPACMALVNLLGAEHRLSVLDIHAAMAVQT